MAFAVLSYPQRLDVELLVEINVCALKQLRSIIGVLQLDYAVEALFLWHVEFLLFEAGLVPARKLAVQSVACALSATWLQNFHVRAVSRSQFEAAHASRMSYFGLPLEKLPRRRFCEECRGPHFSFFA